MTHQGGVPIPVAVFDSNDNQVDSFGGGGGGGGAVTLAAGSVVAGSVVAGALVDGADVTQGTTTGAAVTTDAAGTVQQYLRGLVKLIAAKINISTVDTVTAVTTVSTLSTITNAVPTKGTGFSIPVTLTVTNGAYTVADVAGGLITLAGVASANGKHAIINSVTLAGVVAIPYELWFLSADIATPAADNAAFTIVAADEALVRGIVPISAADYCAAQSAFNVATVRGIGLEVQTGAATTSLYAYLKATAVTSPGTTTLYLRVAGEQID